MSIHCKGEMYMAVGQTPEHGHRNRSVWKGLEVFIEH